MLSVFVSLAPLRLDLDFVSSYQNLVQINFVQQAQFARKKVLYKDLEVVLHKLTLERK